MKQLAFSSLVIVPRNFRGYLEKKSGNYLGSDKTCYWSVCQGPPDYSCLRPLWPRLNSLAPSTPAETTSQLEAESLLGERAPRRVSNFCPNRCCIQPPIPPAFNLVSQPSLHHLPGPIPIGDFFPWSISTRKIRGSPSVPACLRAWPRLRRPTTATLNRALDEQSTIAQSSSRRRNRPR